jgi:hypothetical protein
MHAVRLPDAPHFMLDALGLIDDAARLHAPRLKPKNGRRG